MRHRAPDRQGPEHPRRDQERGEDRLGRVELEDEGEGDADRRRVEQEEEGRQPHGEPRQQEDETEDEGELKDDHPDDDSRALGDVGEQLVR